MNGVIRHVDLYKSHVVRASSLMDDTDLKGEHLQIKHKHIKKERDETHMQPTLQSFIDIFLLFIFLFLSFFVLFFNFFFYI